MWWPGILLLIAAPFVTYGWNWLDRERLVAAHSRQLEETSRIAYDLGKRDGIAEVRARQLGEVAKTREVIKEVERIVEVPPPTPAEIVELCKRSASCRNRSELK